MSKFSKSRLQSAFACALVLGVVGATAQDTPPLLNHTFEENDGGWQGIGGSGAVAVTHDANLVKSGKGALQYSYALKKGEFCLILLPTPDMLLSKAKSMRFWIKTDHATPIAAVMQEKDGGRYNAIFSVPKDLWQQVELSIADFVLDRSKDAPNDPDGKLDMDLVDNFGIADMAQIFIQGDAALATVLGVSEGPRKLYMDDFTVNTPVIPPSSTLKNGEGSLDMFTRPQVGWIAIGEIAVTRVSGKPLEGFGMQAKYHQAPSKFSGVSRYVPVDSFAGAKRLALSAASLKPAKIVVQLEEKSGGKYNTIVELPGNSGRADLTINFADFKASDDSHDDNVKLDLDQVTQIIILDATGAIDRADTDNTLWINNIKAIK